MGATRRMAKLLLGTLAVAGVLTSALLAARPGPAWNQVAVAAAVTTYAAVGCVIAIARPGHPVGRLLLAGATAWGVGEGLLALGVRSAGDDATGPGLWLVVLGSAARGLGWLALVIWLPLVFPDGRLPFRGPRVPALAVGAVGAFTAATLLSPTPLVDGFEDAASPTGLPAGWRPVADALALGSLALAGLTLVLALWGLRRRWLGGDPLVRQQLLWFAVAFALPLLLLPVVATPWSAPWLFAVVSLPLPVAVGVALLQKRLYDVQLVASRALTWTTLWVVLAGTYALVVGGVGALLSERGATWLPWAAAGVVAVAFAPVREVLQRAATRLVYGRWSAPADVLAETGRRLSDAADGRALLAELTAELVSGLGLRFAEITDVTGRRLAGAGSPGGQVEETTLTAYGGPVGRLRWCGPELRAADLAVLGDLAHQIGGVVHAEGVLDQLRDAQGQLVQAREQERRRLRRDLHDGLGPSLAGLGLVVDTIGNRIAAGADPTAELDRLRAGLRDTVVDVRRIVEGLRPPAIDDLGLFGALAELGRSLTAGAGLDLRLDLPEPVTPLPAAVEVAAYRVAQEALTNVVKHSGARSCSVSATVTHEELVLVVSDDGAGDTGGGRAGIGRRSMAERAAEIGGRVVVGHGPPGGTSVRLQLPLGDGVGP